MKVLVAYKRTKRARIDPSLEMDLSRSHVQDDRWTITRVVKYSFVAYPFSPVTSFSLHITYADYIKTLTAIPRRFVDGNVEIARNFITLDLFLFEAKIDIIKLREVIIK